MDHLSGYAHRPFPFVLRYLRRRLPSHVVILSAVVAAVACSVGTQYGVKNLVDALSAGPLAANGVWLAFALLMSLIAADNFLWRIASWTASYTFVSVSGDLRRDMFRHLTGHAPSYFTDRLPGMLTSRITATSNAVYTVENMFVWNVLPPCIATFAAITLVGTVSVTMSAVLILIAGTMVVAMFRMAAAGRPLHDDFANRAAAVDGEMVDVINNLPLVRAFCGLGYEHDRFDATVNRELVARGRSLRYLEKLRLVHAAVTVILTIAMLAWALNLWQQGAATTGDVVLVCTLGISILSATRDLAVALVDVTQHVARLTEALATLLQPHELKDHPEAEVLVKSGAAIAFNNVSFRYPGGLQVFERFSLRIQPGQRVGLVGQSGGGKSTLFTLLQRFYDVEQGNITVDGQDISRVTQQSLRAAISVVPQDISLFPPVDPGEHPLRPAGRHRRRGAAGGDRGALRLHRRPARGHEHHRRRPRRQGLRRPAPADRDRARLPEGRADPAARRGHRGARCGLRGGDPRGVVATDARAYGGGDRAPSRDAAQLRPRARAAGRPDRRGRSARYPREGKGSLPRPGRARDGPPLHQRGLTPRHQARCCVPVRSFEPRYGPRVGPSKVARGSDGS
ncbi:ABC-type multidrug transport system fused ATPase/permease subunit [Bradyrhizobium sp. JR6.1]